MPWISLDFTKLKWTPAFEVRSRIERRLNRDQDSVADDGRWEFANRIRIGADFASGKQVSGKIRYQLGHSLIQTPQRNWSDAHSDLFLAQVDMKQKDGGTLTVGRQAIRKGAGRLFDESNFSQRPKSFDAIRFKNKQFDFFAGRVGMTSNERDFSKVASGAVTWTAGETSVIYRRDDGTRDLSQWTFDHRWTQTKGAWDLAAEGALQFGKAAGLDVKAFWLHGRAAYKIDKKNSAYAEFNVASGGGSATETKTFDPLYGTGHSPYGLMDIQGLRNMRHLEIGLQHKATAQLNLAFSLNFYKLYDPTDGWYGGDSINRRPAGSFRDATGNSGNDVGTEWNLAANYTITKRDSISLELGLFKPGGFVRALNGANTTDQHWALLTYNYKF